MSPLKARMRGVSAGLHVSITLYEAVASLYATSCLFSRPQCTQTMLLTMPQFMHNEHVTLFIFYKQRAAEEKLSLKQAVEAHRVVRRRDSHIC
jgi:hypothetical protein